MTNPINSNIDFAIKSEVSQTYNTLSESYSPINNLPLRVALNGKIYELNSNNRFASHIYRALTLGLKSEWYQSLASLSQKQHLRYLIKFIRWFETIEISDDNMYSVFKDFETYQVNILGLKPQSTGLSCLLYLMKNGIAEIDYERELHQYIEILLLRTNVSKYEPPIPETLTNFFGSIPWLKEAMGNEDYLKLEGPKRLSNSFSVTIATILNYILKIKKEAKNQIADHQFVNDSDTLAERAHRQFYCGNLFSKLSQFDENYSACDPLTELMVLDFVPKKNIVKLKHLWQKRQLDPATYYSYQLNGRQVFTLPNIFAQNAWNYPSELEQVLFSWLCAWQTIQPYDIPKLKKNDFIVTHNSAGRVVFVQSSYYKGRSGKIQEPPMLDAKQVEGNAIISYLEYFHDNEIHLISDLNVGKIQVTFGANSITERLINLINNQAINEEIMGNLSKRKSSPIFCKAMLALYEKKEYAFSKWVNALKKRKKQKKGFSIEAYHKDIEYPLPPLLFGYNAIKNSAVHANSDKYREGDLVNQNSHTSLTEKIHYLTDANKEWVNQNGRITRLVLNDIERHVYKPNLDQAINDAYELGLRTRVIKVLNEGITGAGKIQINSIGQMKYSNETYNEFNAEPDEIIVLDTVETVVTMLHYINQAQEKKHVLINRALTYFERTVLPNVEWMEYLLTSKLSPSTVKKGSVQFETLKSILPPLFLNEIRGSFNS